MTTLATLPALAASNRTIQVIFTFSDPAANFVRVWCVDAPDGSSLAKTLKDNASARLRVYEGAGGANDPWRVTLEEGGKYLLIAQEYKKGSGFGGGFKGDPDGFVTETQLPLSAPTETALTLHIGQRLTQKLGVDADTARLAMWVFNDDEIRGTTFADHGEVTPVIEKVSSERAATAAAASVAAMAALTAPGGPVVSMTTALGDPTATLASLFVTYGVTHAQSPTFHANADNFNLPKLEQLIPPGPKEIAASATALLTLMRRHFTNDGGTGIGTANDMAIPTPAPAPYHTHGGLSVADYANLPLYRSAGTPEDGYAATVDAWRAHDGHRQSLAVHAAFDANSAAPLSPIQLVHLAFLRSLASNTPTPGPTEQTGVTRAVVYGFKET